jgi:hypothetical protein
LSDAAQPEAVDTALRRYLNDWVVSHYFLGGGGPISWQHHGRDLARRDDGGTVTLASDADRDAAVSVLNEAFAEGRLTTDEHAERVPDAYAARTWRELAALTADLPGPAGSPGPTGTAGQTVAGVPGLDWCLLCALLFLCPPAAIAWLLAARHRSGAGRWRAATAAGQPVLAAASAARAGDGWRAEDR